MNLRGRLHRHATAVAVGVLALLAYVPALTSSPGRLPADTKLYLYLDPTGLVGRAASTFEPDQFAGWVPFQQITYLWPSGPWYLIFDALGAPDWIAHRLWIATIMFLAGAGVLWTARLLGLSRGGALIAALVYQVTPFVLAYISRTSLLLLPWAGLGWIVGLTIRATLATLPTGTGVRLRLARWRDPALIALVVATVGSVNATTLAMIVPGPVLWIVHVAWQRRVSWRTAVAVTARIGVLCLAVSVWWISMLYVQSRSGPAVLAYTETLADVSRNATGSEVMRGLGYWLFYQRDLSWATTTASFDHLVGLRTIGLGYLVTIVGFLGLVVTSWTHRRFAALCVGVGMVLAVGVHPVDDPSPLMGLLVGDDEGGLALALRSSTRAVPLLLLGVGLGAGALVSSLTGDVRIATPRRRGVGAVVTGALAVTIVASVPALWNRELVDPAIDRDQDPPAGWMEASERLADSDQARRVLQLPGAEFGVFRWGYTTDHPLVALTDKPVLTRDLLPLGSPGAMDLLFALDDRVQDLTIDPDGLVPVARLFGADTVWLSNDAAFERFRTVRPDLLDVLLTDVPVDGLGPAERVGDPVLAPTEVPVIDPAALIEPRVAIAPVALVPVDNDAGVIRAKTTVVVMSGSGDGIIDAADAGLLSGYELIRRSGDVDDVEELGGVVDDARAVIVTDTNRDQARHWRGSQDTRGHTEPGGPADDVLTATAADQRLDVQPDDPDVQTIAVQDGPVRAVASSYGEPFAYRPEDRAVMAIDGDPTTAWRVADHGDPLGERIRLTITADDVTADSLRLLQPPSPPGARSIGSVRITVDDGSPIDVALDAASRDVGQLVEVPAATTGSTIDIEITGIEPGTFPLAAAVGGVGFAEIDLGLGPTTEWIRPPIDGLAGLAASDSSTPLALVFTRLRVDATDPWRADPERTLHRRFELRDARVMDASATLRLDRRASDADIAELLAPASVGGNPPIASRRITGGVEQRGAAAADGDPTTAWLTPFDGAIGSSLRFDDLGTLGESLVVDQQLTGSSPITEVRLERAGSEAAAVDVAVPAPDVDGRSEVPLPPVIADGDGALTITINAIDARTTVDRRYGDLRVLPAAIAELTATDGIDAVRVDLAAPIEARCDGQTSAAQATLGVDGSDVAMSFSTSAGDLLDGRPVVARACEPLPLAAGTHDLTAPPAVLAGFTVDQVVLAEPDMPTPASAGSLVEVDLRRNDARHRHVEVAACPEGCWVVLGEGFNTEWEASLDGSSLGPPVPVDGGFNGWLLPPSTEPSTVTFRWTAQTPVTTALIVSTLAALGCLALVVATRRTTIDRQRGPRLVRRSAVPGRGRSRATAAALVVAGAMLISPIWALVSLVPAAALVAASQRSGTRSRLIGSRLIEATGLVAAVAVAVSVLWIVRNDRPFPDAGWTLSFDHLNALAVYGAIALAIGAAFAPDADGGRT